MNRSTQEHLGMATKSGQLTIERQHFYGLHYTTKRKRPGEECVMTLFGGGTQHEARWSAEK